MFILNVYYILFDKLALHLYMILFAYNTKKSRCFTVIHIYKKSYTREKGLACKDDAGPSTMPRVMVTELPRQCGPGTATQLVCSSECRCAKLSC